MKSSAEDMLRWAIKNKETSALQNCIHMAEAHSVDAALIAEARALLAKIKSDWCLLAAVRKGDIAKLEAALKTALDLNESDASDAVRQAKLTLDQLKAKKALSTAMSRRNSRQLEEAREQAIVAGIPTATIEKADHMLAKLQAS